MKLTIIGSGTFIPELNRAGPSYLLQANGKNLIFDLGRATIRNLLKIKFDLYKIDKIFISHTHLDHIPDLLVYIQFIWDNPKKDKFKNKIIEIYGPRGFKKSLTETLKALDYETHPHYKRIKFKEIKNKQTISFEKIKITGFEVPHSKIRNCLAYRVESGNKTFCYSGDTPKCKELIDACKNADLALIEADLPKKWKLSHVHMDGEDAGEIATKSRVKNLVLTHVADTYLNEVEKDLKKSYKGSYKIAKDLTEIKI